ncbi:MAG: alpha/beta hydrolase [Chloroflexi bacterium]|nr:alpha/beta hydrolase [Chloroflexota bacterium]
MPHADLGDVKIYYEEAGKGSLAFVFCHGGGVQGGSSFVEEFPFWQQHFPAPKYSLPLYAGDLARLLDYLRVQKAVVLGVSWGGVVVQQFALDYLDRCAAIVTDSSSSEVNLAASENWYQRGEVARLGARARLGEFRPAFAGHTTSAQELLDSDSIVAPEHVDSFVALSRTTAGLREHPLTPRLKHITCPALIIGGGKDAMAGAAGSVIMARNIPNARLHIIQDAGHGVYRQARDEFRKLVLEFCREHRII